MVSKVGSSFSRIIENIQVDLGFFIYTSSMKRIVILGSTGSIGTQTLEVVRNNRDKFEVVGLVANRNVDLLEKQAEEFKPQYFCSVSKDGQEAVVKLVKEARCDIVVVAITGAAGLKPTIAAIESGKNIALATKEAMVLAGELINKLLRENPNVHLFPIDSEHSAIWQSLHSGKKEEVEKIILTSSGGPFRGKNLSELKNVTVEQALGHPTYKMGKKITIDSATMMNKGLEVIEARWLFNIPASKIEVVIHPQSILHSAVQFRDGSIIGQFGLPDMRIPIQYALSYPERLTNSFPRLSLTDIKQLTFEKPNLETFPCLRYAFEAIEAGGTAPVILNAANEIAVDLFLKNKIKFLDIPEVVYSTMVKHTVIKHPSLDQIMEADSWARNEAKT